MGSRRVVALLRIGKVRNRVNLAPTGSSRVRRLALETNSFFRRMVIEVLCGTPRIEWYRPATCCHAKNQACARCNLRPWPFRRDPRCCLESRLRARVLSTYQRLQGHRVPADTLFGVAGCEITAGDMAGSIDRLTVGPRDPRRHRSFHRIATEIIKMALSRAARAICEDEEQATKQGLHQMLADD